MAAGVPTLIFGVLALFFYIRLGDVTEGIVVGEKSIAVLPLENMSPDPENAFFADGVHEDILTNLSRIRDLKVISITSTLRFRDTKNPLKQIGEELGVRYVVEGSVRRANDQVRVTVQLIDSQTDEHLWAESYDRELKDIFAIQSAVAKQIASQLHATILPEESALIDQTPTTNQLAYDYFVQGRNLVTSVESINRSAGFFRKALEIDPDFAPAHIGMSYYYIWMVVYTLLPASDGFLKANEWLNSARALDRSAAEIREISGMLNLWYHWDLEGARNDLEGAILSNTLSAFSYPAYAYLLVVYGENEKAIEAGKKAVELDPLNLHNLTSLANIYSVIGRWEDVEQVCRRLLQMDSNYSEACRSLGMANAFKQQYEEALRFAEKAVELQQGKGWSLTSLAQIYAMAGRKNDARKVMQRISLEMENQNISITAIYASLGEMDEPSVGWKNHFRVTSIFWSCSKFMIRFLRSGRIRVFKVT